MTSSIARSSVTKRIAATCAVLGLAAVGVAAAPKPANAWWYHHGYGYGWGVGVFVPPVVVAPAPAVLSGSGLLRAARLGAGSLRIWLLRPGPLELSL